MKKTLSCLASALQILALAASVGAEEWAFWRGPRQNGVSEEEGLVGAWSPGGEKVLWRQDFTGRSTPVVMGGRVFVNGRTGEGIDRQAVIAAFDAENGELLWERRFNLYLTTVPFNRVGWASLTGDPETGYVYAQNVDGGFLCLDRDGATVWSRSFKEEYGRFEGYGGRTASVLIDEDRVIVNMINGAWGSLAPPRHRYYAFDKRTGVPLWISTPGGNVYDRNTQSVPVVAVVGGRRLVIGGNGDGHVYALESRTGEKVWEFELSKRGINVSPVVEGGVVVISHSEENIDEGTLGRVVAIDATGAGDVTATHEVWRINELQAGFASPLVHGGRVYIVDNSADLYALDLETGHRFWEASLGTVGKASPVWGDAKIYAPETNGHLVILRPGDDAAEILSRNRLTMPDGRYAEFYGSPAVAYGRIYFTTEEGVYCLGDPQRAFRVTETPPIDLGDEGSPAGEAATLLVVPAEVSLRPGESVELEVQAFDAMGRLLGSRRADWTLSGLEGRLDGGRFAVAADSGFQAGVLHARSDGLEATARVRVFPDLPWREGFDAGMRGHWIGAGRYEVREVDGEPLLVKPVAARGLLRSDLILGPPWFGGYTIQADVKATQNGRRRSDGGVFNSGYILQIMGVHQRVELNTWEAELRIDERVDFPVDMDRWYTMKLRVENEGERGLVLGKVWPRGEPEPEEWTITAEDPHPIPRGSPGLTAYSPAEFFYDNVLVTRN